MKTVERNKGHFKSRMRDVIDDPFESEIDELRGATYNRNKRKHKKVTDHRDQIKTSHKDQSAIFLEDGKRRLRILVAQERLAQTRGEPFLKGESPDEIFDAYLRSGLYTQTLEETVVAIRQRGSPMIGNDFVGKVFEDLCYGIMAQRYSGDTVLLSHERGYQLVETLFPYARTAKNPIGSTMMRLREAYLADGFVITTASGEPKVQGVLEYTTGADAPRKVRQVEKYNLMVRKYPTLFVDKPEFSVVLPEGIPLPDGLESVGAQRLEIPVDKISFDLGVGRLWQNAKTIAAGA